MKQNFKDVARKDKAVSWAYLRRLCTRGAALGVGALSLFFAWAAIRTIYGILTGHIHDDLLFGVVTCCDISEATVVSGAVGIAVPLMLAAFSGRWLSVGIWRGQVVAARWVLTWLGIVIASQTLMSQGKVAEARDAHLQLASFAVLLFVLSLPLALSARAKQHRDSDAPIASPHG